MCQITGISEKTNTLILLIPVISCRNSIKIIYSNLIIMMKKYLCVLLLGLGTAGFAQKKPVTAYRPTEKEISDAYKNMERLDSVAKNKVYKATVLPHWQPDGQSFWYRNILKDSVAEYLLVDIGTQKKNKAFDHEKMAASLGKITGKAMNASKLKIDEFYGGKTLVVKSGENWYSINAETYEAEKIDKPGVSAPKEVGWTRQRPRWMQVRTDSFSTDKKQKAYIRSGNVYISDAKGNKPVQVTFDGNLQKYYGELSWSPDNRFIVVYKISPQQDKTVGFFLTSLPNTTRGEVRIRPYSQPGDENPTYEMFIIKTADKSISKVNTEIIDFFENPVIRWRDDNRHFTFEKVDRGHQRFRVIEADAETGKTGDIIDEKTDTFIYEQKIYTYYIPDKKEIIWVSEKDGWRHMYLVDELSGKANPITKGDWVVRGIDSVNVKSREIWFQASGMNPSEDPYHIHYYRIGFDGKNLVKLTHANATHRLTFTPDRTYYLDTYSRMDTPPVTELRKTSDGSLVMELEKADISDYLATGLKLPEIFTAKARDGKTDLWGIVYRPSKFDPKKKYPVIENIYAGPQDSFVPKAFFSYGEMQSMAELGFIVVQVDGMGTFNRSKAFHDVCWKNLADAGLPDRIMWIKQLADKYPQIDTARVGLYGTSAGGQNSLGALLFHPDFYKAAVSACGCHDNRVDKQWWNEQWMGYPVGKHYEEQSNVTNAHKLKGDLLLIVGEADTNVPPESTYRVADALIKANKEFELLTIPGMGHSDGGLYGRRKKRDFFVKSLLGVKPPNRNK